MLLCGKDIIPSTFELTPNFFVYLHSPISYTGLKCSVRHWFCVCRPVSIISCPFTPANSVIIIQPC